MPTWAVILIGLACGVLGFLLCSLIALSKVTVAEQLAKYWSEECRRVHELNDKLELALQGYVLVRSEHSDPHFCGTMDEIGKIMGDLPDDAAPRFVTPGVEVEG